MWWQPMTRPGYTSGTTRASDLAPPKTWVKDEPVTLGREAQLAPPPRPAKAFTTWRTVDPVRACALANAVEIVKEWPEDRLDPTRVTAVAAVFEAYLTGEEVTPDA
jgi:hypothetical protein